jgi:retron-type reverse transcriptase
MSRSHRKTPIAGNTCASSEKLDKRVANRRDRRVNREILNASNDDSRTKDRKTTSDPWVMSKDGKQFFNPDGHPELMRK